LPRRSPGQARRARDSPPGVAGQRRTTGRQHLRCRRSSSGGEAEHCGRPSVTRVDRRREHQHQPAASPQSPQVTTSRSRGVTRGPGTGPGASCPSTRCGTPMPAGLLTWTAACLSDSDADWHSLATRPASSALPRPPLAAPDSDGTHHVSFSGTSSSPRDHGADSRKSATVDPQGDGPVPECHRPTPGVTRAVSKYFDQPEPHVTQSSLPPGPRQAPRGPCPVHLSPGRTDLKSHSTPTEGEHGRNRDVTDRY